MFSKTITNSGKFLKMPATSRLLYYDLGMNADDDGYAEWFTTVRMTGSTEQDLQVLEANGFVKIFDENVLIILNWKENNYLRPDRYTPSKYAGLTLGIPTVDTGKVRLGKDRIGNIDTDLEKPKIEKKKYGEMESVLLTDEEVVKLIERLGEEPLKRLIFELDTYIQSKGAKYKSHYATILNWANRKSKEITRNKGRGLAQ